MPELFQKDIFFSSLQRLWEESGLSKMDFYDKIGIRNAFSVYAPAKPGQKQRKVKAPSVETLLKISKEFHVSVNFLLTGREPYAEAPQLPAGKDYVDLPLWNQALLVERERLLVNWTLEVLRSGDLLPKAATAMESNIEALRDAVERDANRPRPRDPTREEKGGQRRPSGDGQQIKKRAARSG
jgi:hypothetical protein